MARILSHREQKREEALTILKYLDNYQNTVDERIAGYNEALAALPDKWVLKNHNDQKGAKEVERKINALDKAIAVQESYKKIVRIIRELLDSKNLTKVYVNKSIALRKLSEFKTGFDKLDKENEELYGYCEKLIDDDEKRYYLEKKTIIKHSFDQIRQTEFYKQDRKNNPFHRPDSNEFIPKIGSYGQLFKWVNEILDAFFIKSNFQEDKDYQIPFTDDNYLKRIKKIDEDSKEIVKQFEKYKEFASQEEIDDFVKANNSLQKYSLVFKNSKVMKNINIIINLERQLHAINDVIGKLTDNEFAYIYKNTLEELRKKANDIKEELTKLESHKVRDYIRDSSSAIESVKFKIIENLRIKAAIAEDERLEREAEERLQEEQNEEINERIQQRQEDSKQIASRAQLQHLMEELRDEVVEELANKGLIKYNKIDEDSWERDDSEYIREYVTRMRQKLISHGVNLEEVTIISPYKTDEDQYSGGGNAK